MVTRRRPKPPARAGSTASQVFRERCRRIRLAHGLTQQQFVGILDEVYGMSIDRATLARIESGKRRVLLDEGAIIAAALQVPLADLISVDPLTIELVVEGSA